LLEHGDAGNIADAAYRFCRDEPGVHVVLSGTGNPQHLADNIASLQGPPLAPKQVERLKHIFRRAKSVTGG
jgi:aryl-alcohol dehydrogenase-like predicted oxidoreductase